MIGQEKNIDTIIKWRLNRSIPRFIIIEGDRGSGRLTLAKIILDQIKATGIICENSKSAVNDVINNAYTVNSTTCYIFRDADDMSTEAKNALLKVMEEPPNNSYFIMTIRSKENMLATILSRGTLIQMQSYSLDNLRSFTDNESILKLATTPGECKEFNVEDCEKAIDLVNQVCESLERLSGVEVLKHCCQIKAKESETDKLDPILFFRAFKKEFLRIHPDISYMMYVLETQQMMNYNSINKKSLIESMLIMILKELKDGEVSEKME